MHVCVRFGQRTRLYTALLPDMSVGASSGDGVVGRDAAQPDAQPSAVQGFDPSSLRSLT
jgi:hypothetical protein